MHNYLNSIDPLLLCRTCRKAWKPQKTRNTWGEPYISGVPRAYCCSKAYRIHNHSRKHRPSHSFPIGRIFRTASHAMVVCLYFPFTSAMAPYNSSSQSFAAEKVAACYHRTTYPKQPPNNRQYYYRSDGNNHTISHPTLVYHPKPSEKKSTTYQLQALRAETTGFMLMTSRRSSM